jgi:hypothetical protein
MNAANSLGIERSAAVILGVTANGKRQLWRMTEKIDS